MMPYEPMSRDTEIVKYPVQTAFTGSSILEEGKLNETLEDWLFSLPTRQKLFKPPVSPELSSEFRDTSSVYRIFGLGREYTEETYKKEVKRVELLKQMSGLIDKLISEEDIFKRIDKNKLLKSLSAMLGKLPLEQISIPEEELTRRIRKIMALEVMSGLLDDLTPEQLEAFETSVKRRPLFK
ncbi:MAG TPA: hypothetical protein ENF36_02820 [Desulfobacteraceae bacterium]|nr:hypothetical protein [Desulfobacteraceae bacterium]